MKKYVIIGICIILVILLVGVGVLKLKENNDNKLENLYNRIKNEKEYICIISENENNKKIYAKKGSYFLIDDYSKKTNSKDEEIEHTSTLIKDDVMYYIVHNQKEFYVYRNNDNNDIYNALLDELKDIIYKKDGENEVKKECLKGQEQVNGKKYNTEEYSGIFMYQNELNEEDGQKTVFYFKGNKLEYFKVVTDELQKLRKIDIKFEVDDIIFEIPTDYAER